MKKLILGCCLLGWGVFLYAQQGPVTCGGESSGSVGTVSYTIGQTDYINVTVAGSGTVTQGIQQPFEIFVSIGENLSNINLSTAVYPNPTVETLVLKIEGVDVSSFTYQLYDALGQMLMSDKVEGIETSIKMSQLASAHYFLKVLDSNKEVKTYKIIKN